MEATLTSHDVDLCPLAARGGWSRAAIMKPRFAVHRMLMFAGTSIIQS